MDTYGMQVDTCVQVDEDDTRAYNYAVSELKNQPIQGPNGTYHVKNGIIHQGYSPIGLKGFSVSSDYWNIFH
jgi:hypothetical protein